MSPSVVLSSFVLSHVRIFHPANQVEQKPHARIFVWMNSDTIIQSTIFKMKSHIMTFSIHSLNPPANMFMIAWPWSNVTGHAFMHPLFLSLRSRMPSFSACLFQLFTQHNKAMIFFFFHRSSISFMLNLVMLSGVRRSRACLLCHWRFFTTPPWTSSTECLWWLLETCCGQLR
jgi:hypothetical protein